jgi:hypothetical protein
MNKEKHKYVSFVSFVETLLTLKENITKEFSGWNDEDYDFFINKMKLNPISSRKSVLNINKNLYTQKKLRIKYNRLAIITEKYLLNQREFSGGFIKIKNAEYDIIFNNK